MAQLIDRASLVRAPGSLTEAPAIAPTKTSPKKGKKRAFRASDWQAQVRHAYTSVGELASVLALSPEENAGAARAMEAGLPISVTPYYMALVDKRDPACPIRKQVVPHAAEAMTSPGDLEDPLGEVAHEVAPHLVQRYPDRVLLLVTDRCAVYCRFCTRSRIVGDGGGAVSLDALAPALAYIRNHEEIRDVIVSGGDPLTMATPRIVRVLAALREIPHLDTIRIATRVPVTLPMRITTELLRALRPYHPLWIMTHFNHPKELTKEARAACRKLADAGFPVMNQTVLLRGINDQADVLEALFRGLIRERVRPYYLLQADPVRGTAHLRTPLSRGLELMGQLQGRLTSIALPKFICDTPGGKGKVPLYPDAMVSRDGKNTILRTFRGEHVTYVDP